MAIKLDVILYPIKFCMLLRTLTVQFLMSHESSIDIMLKLDFEVLFPYIAKKCHAHQWVNEAYTNNLI